MDRTKFYYGELVNPTRLNTAFDRVENAIHQLALDEEIIGVLSGMEVTEKPIPSLLVQVAAGVARDSNGRRMAVSVTQQVDCTNDTNGNSTAVAVPGNERWVSIFAQRKVLNNDVVGDASTPPQNVPTNVLETTPDFIVVRGSEASTATRPTIVSPNILLCDIKRVFGKTTIEDSDIDITRRQDAFVIDVGDITIRAGSVYDAFEKTLTRLEEHVDGTASIHPASSISTAGSLSWQDGTTNPAADVETQLDKIIQDLREPGGAAKIGASATGAFADGNTVAASSVQGLGNGIVAALAAATGAAKIGAAAQTGGTESVTAASLHAQINQLLTRISAKTVRTTRKRHFSMTRGYGTASNSSFTEGEVSFSGANTWRVPIEVEEGDIITQLILGVFNTSGVNVNFSGLLRRKVFNAASTTIGSGSVNFGASGTTSELLITTSLPHTVDTTRAQYYVQIAMTLGTGLNSGTLEYTRALQTA